MDDHDLIDAVSANGDSAGSSMMSELRAQYEELLAAKEIDIDIPGYGGKLSAKYKLLNVQTDLKNIRNRVNRQFKNDVQQALFGSIDTMIAACIGIYYRPPGSEELLSIAPGVPDSDDPDPVTYSDPRIVSFFGWDKTAINDSRDVVMMLFGKREPMIIDHGMMLARWMSTADTNVNEEFAGNL